MNIAPSFHLAKKRRAAQDDAMALHGLSSYIVVTKEGVTRLGSVQTGWGWLFNLALLPNLFKLLVQWEQSQTCCRNIRSLSPHNE